MLATQGATSQSVIVFVNNATGAPVLGLAAATFPEIKVFAATGGVFDFILVDLASDTSPWVQSGISEIGTDSGIYRVCLPDVVFATAGTYQIAGSNFDTAKRVVSSEINVVSNTVVISPITATTSTQFFSNENLPSVAQGSAPIIPITCIDSNGAAVSLSGKTVRFVVTATNESTATPIFYRETGGTGITISGTGNNVANVQLATANTVSPCQGYYWLWNITDSIALSTGSFSIVPAKKTST